MDNCVLHLPFTTVHYFSGSNFLSDTMYDALATSNYLKFTLMNAHLTTAFKKGFFLTEESLIKLDDIIRKRLVAVDPSAQIKFKVFRVDGMLLEFDNPSDVIAEENSSRNAVIRVALNATGADCVLKLDFDSNDETDLTIESKDRDLAYLLYSDLKEYLNAEVLKFRSFSFSAMSSSRLIFPLVMTGVLFIMMFSLFSRPDPAGLGELIKSTDINRKLNHLIELRNARSEMGNLRNLLIGSMVFMIVVLFGGSQVDKLFPRNIFNWGKAAFNYKKLIDVREKILWGIVIAFIIGIASTIAVEYFKLPH